MSASEDIASAANNLNNNSMALPAAEGEGTEESRQNVLAALFSTPIHERQHTTPSPRRSPPLSDGSFSDLSPLLYDDDDQDDCFMIPSDEVASPLSHSRTSVAGGSALADDEPLEIIESQGRK